MPERVKKMKWGGCENNLKVGGGYAGEGYEDKI